jgi:hypothetical protein
MQFWQYTQLRNFPDERHFLFAISAPETHCWIARRCHRVALMIGWTVREKFGTPVISMFPPALINTCAAVPVTAMAKVFSSYVNRMPVPAPKQSSVEVS